MFRDNNDATKSSLIEVIALTIAILAFCKPDCAGILPSLISASLSVIFVCGNRQKYFQPHSSKGERTLITRADSAISCDFTVSMITWQN